LEDTTDVVTQTWRLRKNNSLHVNCATKVCNKKYTRNHFSKERKRRCKLKKKGREGEREELP